MASAVDICNKALRAVGEDRITALTDDSERARLCDELYPFARDSVLREHPWRCALTRAALSRLTATPAFGYDYMHQIPTECMRIVGVFDASGKELTTAGDWAKEAYNDGDATKQVIVTDEDTLYLHYVRKETDTAQYDSLLVESVAARLAAELAERLPKTDSVTTMMWNLYRAKLLAAKSVDATEAAPPDAWASSWENEKF